MGAMETLRVVIPNADERDDIFTTFNSSAFKLWRCQSEVVNIQQLPMPFQYFHIMNLMLLLNLTLWGYALGCQDSHFAPVIYMFVQLMFQGIRELATSLSNPFGTDDVDFKIAEWMKKLYASMYSVLQSHTDCREFDLHDDTPLRGPHRIKNIIDVWCEDKVEEVTQPLDYILPASVRPQPNLPTHASPMRTYMKVHSP